MEGRFNEGIPFYLINPTCNTDYATREENQNKMSLMKVYKSKMTPSANSTMDVVVGARSGRQGSCCNSLLGIVIDKQSPKNVRGTRFLTCRVKLRFRFFLLSICWSTIFAKMDDQAHKPHRKSKERKEKKGKSGG